MRQRVCISARLHQMVRAIVCVHVNVKVGVGKSKKSIGENEGKRTDARTVAKEHRNAFPNVKMRSRLGGCGF